MHGWLQLHAAVPLECYVIERLHVCKIIHHLTNRCRRSSGTKPTGEDGRSFFSSRFSDDRYTRLCLPYTIFVHICGARTRPISDPDYFFSNNSSLNDFRPQPWTIASISRSKSRRKLLPCHIYERPPLLATYNAVVSPSTRSSNWPPGPVLLCKGQEYSHLPIHTLRPP